MEFDFYNINIMENMNCTDPIDVWCKVLLVITVEIVILSVFVLISLYIVEDNGTNWLNVLRNG